MPLRTDAKIVIGAFLASGTVHLVKPEVFEPLMPSWIPAHREVIIGSGVAELACAVGMLVPLTRRPAALASAALLVGVFPGNVQMAADALRGDNRALQAASLARLPL
ncbi:MAG TPA: DoxX family protein, partial [Nocardioides sp.]|nr:DoxX family protein [Nocardioides sp.]